MTKRRDPEIEMHVSPRMMITGIEEVDERNVLIAVHQTALGRESGVPAEMDSVLLFEVVGGRARRFHVHPDRESAVAAI